MNQIDNKDGVTTKKNITYYFKRTALAALLMGTLSILFVACGEATPLPVTPTSPAVEGSASTPTPDTGVSTDAGNSTPVTSDVVSPTAEAGTGTDSGISSQPASCAKLNLNTLTEESLMATIPNFSSRMVREFFEYRPYVSIQQFRKEIGKYVDVSQVAEYEKYVYVPVDPNNADAETLNQLQGVDDTVAADLIKARPYASNDAFLQALSAQVTAQQAAEAKCYLMTP
jgi:radical SAM superfamily enzyme with C-terminal helix-hairpin-helix motif